MAEKIALLIDSNGVPVGTNENPLYVVASGVTGGGAWGEITGDIVNQVDLYEQLETKIAIPSGFDNERKVLFSLDIDGKNSFTSGIGLDLSGRVDFDGKTVVNAVIDGGDLEGP